MAHTQTNCEYISEGNSFGSTDIFVLGCHKAVILVETESKAVIVDIYESWVWMSAENWGYFVKMGDWGWIRLVLSLGRA